MSARKLLATMCWLVLGICTLPLKPISYAPIYCQHGTQFLINVICYQPTDVCCICGGGKGNGGGGHTRACVRFAPTATVNPNANSPGAPPWNNAGCSTRDIAEQLDSINPYPQAGGKNLWHPPSKQVSVGHACVVGLHFQSMSDGTMRLYVSPD